MSLHTRKVASVLARAIQNVLSRGLNDPRVRGLTSVTEVRVSDDLAHATVLVSVIPAEHAALTLHGLRHATSHIHGAVARQVRLRRMPRLTFKLDDSLKRESSVIAAINAARERDETRTAGPPEDHLSSERTEKVRSKKRR